MDMTKRLATAWWRVPAKACAMVLIGMLVASAAPTLAADAAGASPSRPARAGKATVAKHRIVVQVTADDSKTWNSILGNLHNIQDELRGDGGAEIRVVAISGGLGMLTAESLAANRVQDAMADGVHFVACGNSMQAQQINKEDLITGVSVVKAGYVEVHRLQQQGWTYLRP